MHYSQASVHDLPKVLKDSLLNLITKKGSTTWFVSGGSAIALEVSIMQQLAASTIDLTKLTVLLNDERFGSVRHPDSNWEQLRRAGFMVDGPRFIPPYTEEEVNLDQAVARYQQIVADVLSGTYSFSLLGMGTDGHVSGILPDSPAAKNTTDLVCGYQGQPYERLTTTFSALQKFDEVALVAYGEAKWPQLARLAETINRQEQPVQVIKDILDATIYTDYQNQ